MVTRTIKGVTVDLSRVESDGMRWFGHVTITRGTLVAVATWAGRDRSDMGNLADMAAEDEAFGDALDAMTDELEEAITETLGNPRDEDPTGLFAALDAVAHARDARRVA